jgi:hypothetical protein
MWLWRAAAVRLSRHGRRCRRSALLIAVSVRCRRHAALGGRLCCQLPRHGWRCHRSALFIAVSVRVSAACGFGRGFGCVVATAPQSALPPLHVAHRGLVRCRRHAVGGVSVALPVARHGWRCHRSALLMAASVRCHRHAALGGASAALSQRHHGRRCHRSALLIAASVRCRSHAAFGGGFGFRGSRKALPIADHRGRARLPHECALAWRSRQTFGSVCRSARGRRIGRLPHDAGSLWSPRFLIAAPVPRSPGWRSARQSREGRRFGLAAPCSCGPCSSRGWCAGAVAAARGSTNRSVRRALMGDSVPRARCVLYK